MSGAQRLSFVRRHRMPLGHLTLELGLTECGALPWALRTEHAGTPIASGFIGPSLASEFEAAGAAIRNFAATAASKGETPCR